ncbi:MAG: hypothetical protein U0270_36855 [Labilithrix sp.]
MRGHFVATCALLFACSDTAGSPASDAGASSSSGSSSRSAGDGGSSSGSSSSSSSSGSSDGATSASRCPPFPAIPDAACTGVPPGVTLQDCSSDRLVLTKAGEVFENCRFNGDVVIQANDITIRSSLVKGRIDAGDQSPGHNLTLIDVEVDGGGSGGGYNVAGIGSRGFSCLRCNVHGGGHGIAAEGDARVEDSFIHDFAAVSADDHMGGIAAHGGSKVKIIHSNVECSYSGRFDGLCSSAVGMYGDFAPIDDYELKNNLFNTQDGYCVYGGSSSSKPFPHATNVRYVDNLFGKKFGSKCGYYGPVSSFEIGNTGNVWSGNRWQDGSGDVPAAN